MFKLSGAVLMLFGTVGFSWSICKDYKKRLLLLKNMREMYRLLQKEICYTALPLPEIFRITGSRLEEPFGKALLSISQSMALERGEDFSEIWESGMERCLQGIPLTKEQKALLLRFPESTGMNECRGQAEALKRYIDELDRFILQMEGEEKSKNKVIMSLGIAAGLFMVIILL